MERAIKVIKGLSPPSLARAGPSHATDAFKHRYDFYSLIKTSDTLSFLTVFIFYALSSAQRGAFK